MKNNDFKAAFLILKHHSLPRSVSVRKILMLFYVQQLCAFRVDIDIV